MDHILLCTNHIPLTTSIHNTFIENNMLEANGDYVKVYLYLAKCIQYGEQGLSISSLADRMDNTEKDVLRALQYWEKKGLLQINRDTVTGDIVGIDMLSPEKNANHFHHATTTTPSVNDQIAATQDSSVNSKTVSIQTNQKENRQVSTAPEDQPEADQTSGIHRQHTSKEITITSSRLKELATDDEFIWTCHVIENYLERPMKPNETRLISYLYDTLQFSKELLLYLYEYCISLGKTNCNYIQAVALSWDEQGVTTPEEAEQASTAYNSTYNAVSKALALGRALAAVEKKFVDRWQKNWGMDLGVILEACNRTVLKLHGADFKYTEGILDHWRQSGVHTLQDVERADLAYAQNKAEKKQPAGERMQNKSRNQFQNFQQREASSQEVDDLERKLLMR